MSLSQYAIFLYTSSHTVTVSASRILGMNLVTPGSSWISITTSWEVQKHRHQFLISPINSSHDYFPQPFLRSTLNKCEAARFRCGFVMHALFHPRADLHLLWAILTNSLRCALDTAGRFKLLSNSGDVAQRLFLVDLQALLCVQTCSSRQRSIARKTKQRQRRQMGRLTSHLNRVLFQGG